MTASWQLAFAVGVVVGLGTGTMASVLGAMVAKPLVHGTPRRRAGPAHGQLRHRPAPVPALLASMVVRLGWRSAVLLGPASPSSCCRWWPR